MKARYYANMSVGGGSTCLQNPIVGSNLRKLSAEISQIARGNCPTGSEYTWKVWDGDGDVVAAGAGRKTVNGFAYYDCSGLVEARRHPVCTYSSPR